MRAELTFCATTRRQRVLPQARTRSPLVYIRAKDSNTMRTAVVMARNRYIPALVFERRRGVFL